MDSEDKPAGYDWASGFLMGMRLGGIEWNSYLQDDEHAGVFIPIFMLFHENDPDPALRPDPISDEQREKLFAGISVGVPKMYAYMAPFRDSKSMGAKRPVTLPRKTQKIGRNDPCPCKSGLKYKKCCGKH